jgi:hypothetical protein
MEEKRSWHHHQIIQQLIPAPGEVYAVFLRFREEEDPISGGHPLGPCDFQRVPCFALVAPCKKKFADDDEPCAADLNESQLQTVVPCVGAQPFMPYGGAAAWSAAYWHPLNPKNKYYLGLQYGKPTEEDMAKWQERGAEQTEQLYKEQEERRGQG